MVATGEAARRPALIKKLRHSCGGSECEASGHPGRLQRQNGAGTENLKTGALEKARAKRAERRELTADWVVDELRKIAGANMADYLKSTTHGDPR